MIAMMMVEQSGVSVGKDRKKRKRSIKTVLFTGIMAAIMFATLWQYQNTMQGQRRNMGIWSGAQQYAETLLKKKDKKSRKRLAVIGDESWREGKNTYHIRLTYYSDDDAEKKKAERVNISTSFVLMKQKGILSNPKVFRRRNINLQTITKSYIKPIKKEILHNE